MEWSLIVGPGARLAELLAYLVPDSVGGDCGRIVTFAALPELLLRKHGKGRLLLDADALDLEDLGLVRAVLANEPGLELVLVGQDATRRAARVLVRQANATWIAWPPDLDDLKRIGRAPSPSTAKPGTERASLQRAPQSAPPRTAPTQAGPARTTHDEEEPLPMDAVGDELAQIEAILGTQLARRPLTAEPASAAPAWDPAPSETRAVEELTEPELEPLDEIELQPAPRGSLPTPSSAPPRASSDAAFSARQAPPDSKQPAPDARANAPWFPNQVADLADLAQRIELGLMQIREGAQASEEAIEALSGPIEELTHDVARLLQFTRTLGYHVAPPPRGAQRFELGELVDLHTRALVERGKDGPRCLARKNGGAMVRSDRQLVSQALDALFFLAGHAAVKGEIVRVQLRTEDGKARLTIEFPAGPLVDLDPARIVEPYALRRLFPELGANALAAATGILRGQGGELVLARRGDASLEWVLTLPIDANPAGASAENPFG